MTDIREEMAIQARPDLVWELAGDPGRIAEWLPALDESSLEDDQRACTLESGGKLVERIVDRSDEERYYTYEIVESPLPLRNYRSRFEVRGHGDHSHVIWTAEFEPTGGVDEAELEAMFVRIYSEGLESLRTASEVRQAA